MTIKRNHIGWYFAPEDRKLRYGDNRVVKAGITHTVDCKPELCKSGLHWSERAIDALWYAPGPIACRVEGGGKVIEGDDKIVGTSRKYLAVADATDVLRRLARKWALDVIQLWDAPQVVKDYLETGDENLAYAASCAAYAADDAARAAYAASCAAEAASWAADAASWAADAAWCAVHAASCASWAAAYDATAGVVVRLMSEVVWAKACEGIKKQQNTELEKALFELLGVE